MEKQRLHKLLMSVDDDKDAIVMIISNFIDVGDTRFGGCVSGAQFGKIAEFIIEWIEKTNTMQKKTIKITGDKLKYIFNE